MFVVKKIWGYIFLLSTIFISLYAQGKSFSYPRSSSKVASHSKPYYRPPHNNNHSRKTSNIDIVIGILCVIIWLLCMIDRHIIGNNKGNKDYAYLDYDKISDWFDKHRSRKFFEKKYIDRVISYLKPNAKILDVGCGMGEPILQYFIEKKINIIGIDGSKKLIELAQKRYPDTHFMIGDMRTIQLDDKFDCIVVWHSLFHLPVEDQRRMFQIFANYLNPDGILLFTSGADESEVWSDNGGIKLYHASLDASEYKKLLIQHNFELLAHVVEDEDCGDATVWIAKLK